MKKLFYIIIIGLFFTHHSAHAVQLNSKGIETFDKSIKVWVNFDIPAGKTSTKISASVYSGSTKLLGPEIFTATAANTNFVLDTSSLWNGITYTLKVTDDVPQSDTITTDFLNKNSAPKGVTKAGSGDFYYTTSYDLGAYSSDLHASFFRFTSASLCNTAWQKEIDNYYTTPALSGVGRRSYTFTPCFQSTGKIPTETEFRDKLKPYGTFPSSSPFYYYTWKQADRSWGGSIGYKTKEKCEADEKTQSGMGIITHCTASSTPPMQPVNWDGTQTNTTDVSATTEITPYNGDYNLLAPIGDLTVIKGAKEGEPADPNNSIGGYLNTIFKIAIGLMGALAVVMIVIHGIQYMGDESVFGKTEAKHSIMTTIGGLLLALCAYALLNTINPDLLGGDGVYVESVNISISANDTSTGSSNNLCVSKTNPPNPDAAQPTYIDLKEPAKTKYLNAQKTLSFSTGAKLLITAQTAMEGFSANTLSYKTNNPGNIGNTDDGKTRSFPTLEDGIKAQLTYLQIAQQGNVKGSSYIIGGKYDCALNGTYDGSLYQYLRIYSTGARKNNNYVNAVIGYFKQNGKIITARTKISDIYKMQ